MDSSKRVVGARARAHNHESQSTIVKTAASQSKTRRDAARVCVFSLARSLTRARAPPSRPRNASDRRYEILSDLKLRKRAPAAHVSRREQTLPLQRSQPKLMTASEHGRSLIKTAPPPRLAARRLATRHRSSAATAIAVAARRRARRSARVSIARATDVFAHESQFMTSPTI